MGKVCIGIDLGGSFIKFGTLDENGKPGKTQQLPTPAKEGPDAIIKQILGGIKNVMADEKLAKDQIVGLGLGSPGPLSVKRGILLDLPNIPNMKNVPIARIIGEAFGIPATLENDANAAAFGEYLCGAGKGCENIVMLTLGTGLGGGVIQNGSVLHGTHEIGGELGHMIIHPGGRLCGCGQKGCIEQYCSAFFLAKYCMETIRREMPESSLTDTLDEKGCLSALDIELAHRAGDQFANEQWEACCYNLAIGCINLCRIFDPDRIVLAGGMSKAGDELVDPTVQFMKELNWKMFKIKTPLAINSLGSDAGMIGAAGLAWQEIGKKNWHGS